LTSKGTEQKTTTIILDMLNTEAVLMTASY